MEVFRRWKCCVLAKIWKVNVEEGCRKDIRRNVCFGYLAFALGQRVNDQKP